SGGEEAGLAPEPSSLEHLEELGLSPSAYGAPESISHRSSSTKGPLNVSRLSSAARKALQRSEDRIKEDIQEALALRSELDASEVDLSCRGGIVTLQGKVEHRRSRSQIESCVEAIDGVRNVINTPEIDAAFFSRHPDEDDSNDDRTK
ncbi:MAG: BON domain-containing protein, partial [Planctomycetota bacterium]